MWGQHPGGKCEPAIASRRANLEKRTMSDKPVPNKKYRVKLGFNEVSVECNSREEAIRLARTKLSDDLPRLYDVIHKAEESKFQVDEVQDDSSR